LKEIRSGQWKKSTQNARIKLMETTQQKLKIIILWAVAIIVVFAIGLRIFGSWHDEWSGYNATRNDDCTASGIKLHGTLLVYVSDYPEEDASGYEDVVSSEDIVFKIKQANEDSSIKAIIIEVNSGGGSPVAGEEIFNAIKNSAKPVVAYIRLIGASSSYLAISSSEKIFASKYSDVGSIGITMSYLTNIGKNQKDGYEYQQLSSGIFKDVLSLDKPLTNAERILLMRDVNIMYQDFIKDVSKNRNIPIDEVKSFADGSTVLGEKAKELGLIDEIGGINEVEQYLEKITGKKAEVCW
jgi:protease-4